ncbi:Arv1-like family-domain-containing protein [Chaetomium tenue]|uniref:Arv1-like family-domain-containing protein n=1 Tax=Chaetomium tenue TaxID=1854479 RepID=A0ACB7P8K8_9PEZI|nr:Arv1-like family-domain-containing protein [Chaetomium globosum]
MIPSRTSSSSTLLPTSRESDAASIRPRNRRLLTTQDGTGSPSAFSSPSRTPSRGASPIPSAHIGSVTGRNNAGIDVVHSTARGKSPGAGRGLLDGSWTSSWASVQELASSLLTGGGPGVGGELHRPGSRDGSRARKPTRQSSYRVENRNETWGPQPPNEGRPSAGDIAAGSRAEREATLKAMRTASVLESHEGVNGGLDVARRFKKRSSDEDLRNTSQNQETEAYLAYIHHVQATDTYAGIVLKYRCREDAFRKANGLWSRDNIQVRKWLAMPVDACEVRGRPCDPPANPSSRVDLLARTPDGTDPFGRDDQQKRDFFSNPPNGQSSDQNQAGDNDRPWTRVRWVSIDSHPHPIEVARVPRKALGYFPPRRKKSVSAVSTPRASMDLPNTTASESAADSPGSSSSRRPSLLTSRRPSNSTTTSPANRGRINSTGSGTSASTDDPRPAWMRRPGGVGSMGRNVRAPGPERDYFNTWTNKHLPGLNIDSLPSMSVMGSEMARFGFLRAADNPSVAIAESPFEDGRDATSPTTQHPQHQQGTGLDKAAATVETWLRGAFERARQGVPLTPVLGPRGRTGGGGGGGVGLPEVGGGGDLIELADTGSDDGRYDGAPRDVGGLLSSPSGSTSASGSRPGHERPAPRNATTVTMPICIECRHPVKTLWREGGGDKSGGHNIRLTVCKNCGRFCDKYVEHDFVVLFIDLVLIKPQVYRHLLHNTLMKEEDQFASSIIRLGILLLLFDVYLTWARIERQSAPADPPDITDNENNFGRLAQQPIVFQYMFFLILCTLSTIAFHASIRFLTSSRYSPLAALGLLPRYSRPNSVSTALLVSSSTKLFPILMVIWEYDVPAAARSLGWAVVANNVEALKILLDCGYGVAALLAMAGAVSRWAMGRAVLWAAGLEGVDSAGESGVAEDGRAFVAMLMYAREWAGRLAVG